MKQANNFHQEFSTDDDQDTNIKRCRREKSILLSKKFLKKVFPRITFEFVLIIYYIQKIRLCLWEPNAYAQND